MERKHQVAMKPNFKNLALYEQFSGNTQHSNGAYTKAIGLATNGQNSGSGGTQTDP